MATQKSHAGVVPPLPAPLLRRDGKFKVPLVSLGKPGSSPSVVHQLQCQLMFLCISGCMGDVISKK
eukprot:4820846-Amphidinium_carterae.2